MNIAHIRFLTYIVLCTLAAVLWHERQRRFIPVGVDWIGEFGYLPFDGSVVPETILQRATAIRALQISSATGMAPYGFSSFTFRLDGSMERLSGGRSHVSVAASDWESNHRKRTFARLAYLIASVPYETFGEYGTDRRLGVYQVDIQDDTGLLSCPIDEDLPPEVWAVSEILAMIDARSQWMPQSAEPGATANPDPGEKNSAKSTLLDRHPPGV